MEKDWISKCMNLTYCHFFQETLINTSEYQVSRWENIKDKYASMTKQYLIKNRWLGTAQLFKKIRGFFYLKTNGFMGLLKIVEQKFLKCPPD